MSDDVLFVCTGNQCRSPMAAALLQNRLRDRRPDIAVSSAGFMSQGIGPPPEVLKVMERVGIDLSSHLSVQLDPAILEAASIVVGMTRQHLIDLTVESPANWNRCFTLTDLLARAEAVGGVSPGESLRQWAGRLAAGRRRNDILSLRVQDDIADPMGGRLRAYESVRDRITAGVEELVGYISPA